MMPLRFPLSLSSQATVLLTLGVFFEAFLTLRVSGGITLGDALILASAALLIVRAFQGRTRIWMPPWLLVAFPLIVGGTVIDAVFAGRFDRADAISCIELVFCTVVLPAVIVSQPADRLLAQRLLQVWIAGTLVGAAIASFQFLWHDLGPLNHWLMRNGDRVAGLNPNANTLGATLALVMPLCLAFAVEARRPAAMVMWAGSVLLCLYVIDLTGSRTSFVSAVLGSVTVLLLFGTRTRPAEFPWRLVQIAGALLLTVAAWQLRTGFYDSAVERLLGHSPTASLSNWFREGINRASLAAIREAPFFGYGYGHMRAHNTLMALVEGGGLAGLIGFMLAQAGLLTGAIRLYARSHNDASIRGFAVGALGVWCAWVALGIYDVSILNRNAYVAFGLTVLWLVATHTWAVEPAPAPADLPTRGTRLRTLREQR